MPTFQVRNRVTKMVLGEVTVDDLADVLDELKDATGSSIEEIASSLGRTVEEAKAALDIVPIRISTLRTIRTRNPAPSLPPRSLFG